MIVSGSYRVVSLYILIIIIQNAGTRHAPSDKDIALGDAAGGRGWGDKVASDNLEKL